MALLKPLLTEKTMRLAQNGQFSFVVTKAMTKAQVATVVKEMFAVEPVRVNMISLPAKAHRTGTKRLMVSGAKRFKAIVTLKPGQMIEYFATEKKEEKKTTKTKTK